VHRHLERDTLIEGKRRKSLSDWVREKAHLLEQETLATVVAAGVRDFLDDKASVTHEREGPSEGRATAAKMGHQDINANPVSVCLHAGDSALNPTIDSIVNHRELLHIMRQPVKNELSILKISRARCS
jgi:hypothetical protein